ncbi:MAG: RNA 2'-phosphotransferase [Frankiaceae bacterium]
MDRTALSKAVARALRHDPGRYGLAPDDAGWVPVGDLVRALRGERRWRDLQRTDLVDLVDRVGHGSKQRYEIDGERIRALYGHSLPGRIAKEAAEPPAVLFHGTARQSLPGIRATGLSPMRRQYVHLSVDRETAAAVGRRKGADVAVLAVFAGKAHRAGVVFRRGNAATWLAEHVPPEFISGAGRARGDRGRPLRPDRLGAPDP